ncbi:hypothetical protein GCM10007890_21140 [Methylobacterium tardum]|uniref:Uncharacterized protein n=1 Tax=Methylobacterium tardum TaxID=374432 RepID=A0AA37TB27_9HYPH|nr:hypothetical protein GCM10007890_21140 [Methylobacterium tardum]
MVADPPIVRAAPLRSAHGVGERPISPREPSSYDEADSSNLDPVKVSVPV